MSEMSDTMKRRHPDLFTPDEAAEYLHLEGPQCLAALRDAYQLTGRRVGKGFMYHREELDTCALRIFDKDAQWQAHEQPRLKLSGGRR
jgi:hypothetical protein